MSIKITDKSGRFIIVSEKAADRALNGMAIDIEILAKTKNVPVKTSRLQNTIIHFKVGRLHWRVPADTEYARFQEFGGDSKRKVRNYSKPGTGKHYLRNSGDDITKKAIRYFKQYMGNIKV